MAAMYLSSILLLLICSHPVISQSQTRIIQLTAADVVRNAIQLATSDLNTQSAIQSLSSQGTRSGSGNKLQGLFSKRSLNSNRSRALDDAATIGQITVRNIMVSRNMDFATLQRNQALVTEFNRQITPYCDRRRPFCDSSYQYRLPDGTCNNLRNPLLGSSLTAQQRLLAPKYDDEVKEPRTRGANNRRLPSPRVISNKVHATGRSYFTSGTITALFTHWGEFVHHDIIHTPALSMDCCSGGSRQLDRCFGIDIPPRDPNFPRKRCMNFVRSDSAPPMPCGLAPRQQVNERTSYLDGSGVYGNDGRQVESLRDLNSRERGQMKVSQVYNLMPRGSSECLRTSTDYVKGYHCFDAGDHRSLTTPAVSTIHLAVLREHNRIAKKLGELNSNWTNDIVFQETRKIVTALIQHITYNEFLPIVLTNYYMTNYGLWSSKEGYNTIYNDAINPAIFNSFGAAAFRFGHSLVRHTLSHANMNSTIVRTYRTKDTFFRPTSIWDPSGKGADGYARWLVSDNQARSDRHVEPDLRNHLFVNRRTGDALDLVSLNIQRGRDHGLPGYNEFRQYCGLSRVFHFGTGAFGLSDHEADVAALLNDTYRHPDDIDLIVGGLTEIPENGGLVGPTFSCIIALQFYSLKYGDRYWYENQGLGFTPGQLNEIKRQTMTNLLCRNLVIKDLQRAAFISPSDNNKQLECKRYGDIQLEFWRDGDPQPAPVADVQTTHEHIQTTHDQVQTNEQVQTTHEQVQTTHEQVQTTQDQVRTNEQGLAMDPTEVRILKDSSPVLMRQNLFIKPLHELLRKCNVTISLTSDATASNVNETTTIYCKHENHFEVDGTLNLN